MQAAANTTAERLVALARLYQQGQSSQLMDRTLDKLLAHEAEQAHTKLTVLADDLTAFEEQYHLTSAEFYTRYQSGQMDDRLDFVEWASLLRMRNNLLRRLQLLTGERAT